MHSDPVSPSPFLVEQNVKETKGRKYRERDVENDRHSSNFKRKTERKRERDNFFSNFLFLIGIHT